VFHVEHLWKFGAYPAGAFVREFRCFVAGTRMEVRSSSLASTPAIAFQINAAARYRAIVCLNFFAAGWFFGDHVFECLRCPLNHSSML
jgi:hypothetical protein